MTTRTLSSTIQVCLCESRAYAFCDSLIAPSTHMHTHNHAQGARCRTHASTHTHIHARTNTRTHSGIRMRARTHTRTFPLMNSAPVTLHVIRHSSSCHLNFTQHCCMKSMHAWSASGTVCQAIFTCQQASYNPMLLANEVWRKMFDTPYP